MATIAPTTWADLRSNMRRLGYRHTKRVWEEIDMVREAFVADSLVPLIAEVPSQPPLALVKGPLFRPEEVRDVPNVDFVITLTHEYPNAVPIITIEKPPPGWRIRRHTVVQPNGQCTLRAVGAWNPRSSSLLACLQELNGVLRIESPFERCGAPVQQPRAAQQPPAPAPAPRAQQPQARPMNPAVASTVIGANVVAATSQSGPFNFAAADFEGMLQGASKPPGTTVATPSTFGIGPLVAGPRDGLMRIQCNAPVPPPPITDPTPDEQFAIIAEKKRREVEAESARPAKRGFMGKLTAGAKMMSGAAVSAQLAVEDQVRSTAKANDAKKFAKAFPSYHSEQLLTTYYASMLAGDGTPKTGRVYLTSTGLHFTTRTLDDADGQCTFVYSVNVPLRDAVTLVQGLGAGKQWLHLVLHDNTVVSLFDIDTDFAGKIGSVTSLSLGDSPHGRFLNWVDHAWRAAARVPNLAYPYANIAYPVGGPQPQREPQPQPQRGSTPPTDPQSASTTDICVVCMDRPRAVFLQPCGHVAMCAQCATVLSECPICRTTVTSKLQAFL